MSKTEFVDIVAKAGKTSRAEAKRTVELVFGAVAQGLKTSKGSFRIGTFGVFTVTKRPARLAMNPRTGETIKVKPSRSLRFKPAAQLKKAAGC